MQGEAFAGILVGDMSQPRGGPMKTGHRIHQSGLDADLWFREAPDYKLSRDERHKWSAYSVVAKGWPPQVNEKFDDRVARLIQLAAWDHRTARVFVAAIIKKDVGSYVAVSITRLIPLCVRLRAQIETSLISKPAEIYISELLELIHRRHSGV